MATMIETARVGQPAPDFDMASTKNIEKLDENVKLTDYNGKWLVLLFKSLTAARISRRKKTLRQTQFFVWQSGHRPTSVR